jgi:hypothetical protein
MSQGQQFGRWALIGVAATMLEAVAIAIFVHLRYLVEWRDLLPPVALCSAIQIVFFICAFWARRFARERGRYGPITFLVGGSSWGLLLIVMHYASLWRIIAPIGDPLSFSIFMILITLVSWFIMDKTRQVGRQSPGNPNPGPK